MEVSESRDVQLAKSAAETATVPGSLRLVEQALVQL